jgi:DNA-binding NarL/FixJ family response regulator
MWTLPVVTDPDACISAATSGGQRASCLRVVIADDDVLMRVGLASLLDRPGFKVVGQAADAVEVVSLVDQHHPDLAVVDIRMPLTHSTEGLDAAKAIRQESTRHWYTSWFRRVVAIIH